MMKPISLFCILSLIVILVTSLEACRQVKKEKSSNELNLYFPADLEATLWAESPMFYNPTNMDVDDRGRIWVTEAVNYRNYNNDSTKFLHHSQGDRIMILEDTTRMA